MNWPYEVRIGWRYTRAGRAGRRNGFISFISGVSMLGIALGVAALIIVLSVMNGFQKEVRDRMLSVIAHVEIFDTTGSGLARWQTLAEAALQNPQVAAAAPFVAAQALLARGEDMHGVMVRGISPAEEATVTPLAAQLKDTVLTKLQPGAWGVVLGTQLARSMGVVEGDSVTLVTPSGQTTPAGVVPRLKQMTVVGVFNAGHYEYDSGLVLMHIDDAARLFRTGGPQGVQLRLKDQQLAREVSAELTASLGPQVLVRDWTRTNAAWYDAVQIEKRMMFIILTLIVAVAAFNLVSTLVMTVTDKQADIAILRTLGQSPLSIMGVFMVQGVLVGTLGIALGVLFGVLLALNLSAIVQWIETSLGVNFISPDVYYISELPSDLHWNDVTVITITAFLFCIVATLYPAWRAARTEPAAALRYE